MHIARLYHAPEVTGSMNMQIKQAGHVILIWKVQDQILRSAILNLLFLSMFNSLLLILIMFIDTENATEILDIPGCLILSLWMTLPLPHSWCKTAAYYSIFLVWQWKVAKSLEILENLWSNTNQVHCYTKIHRNHSPLCPF